NAAPARPRNRLRPRFGRVGESVPARARGHVAGRAHARAAGGRAGGGPVPERCVAAGDPVQQPARLHLGSVDASADRERPPGRSPSEAWKHKLMKKGRPAAARPKGYRVSNTTVTDKPICTASKQYQDLKLKSMGYDSAPPLEGADDKLKYVYAKQCICDQLGS